MILIAVLFLYCCICYYIDRIKISLFSRGFIKPPQVIENQTNVVHKKKQEIYSI